MELHDHMYSLGLQLGRQVFDDADGFRGALDDFLDEGAASTGDINLLVDAVRLGAYRSMVTMLDSGADAQRAIQEAGSRLARDRGSADVAGSQWALAVLGFAIGKVSDGEVRRYRAIQSGASQTPAPPPSAPTVLPTTPPQPGPAQPGPPQSGPAGVPPALPTQFGASAPAAQPQPPASAQQPYAAPPPGYPQPSYGSGSAGVPPFGGGSVPNAGSWGAPQQPKKKVWPLVVAIVAVLAVIGGGATAFLLTQGDDGSGDDNKTDGRTTSTGTPTPEVSYAFEDINERYQGLAANITTGLDADSCEPSTSMSGQTENLTCTFSGGTLTLITWQSLDDLKAERKRQITFDPGGVYVSDKVGELIAYEDAEGTGDERVVTEAYVYVDATDDLVSARYDALPGDTANLEVDKLVTLYNSASPTIEYPDGPTDPDLIGFSQQWVDTKICRRIRTIYNGETEESNCDVPGAVNVYIGQFKSIQDLRRQRRTALGYAKDDGTRLRTWNQQEGDPPEGALYEYTTAEGTVARYWDQPDCLCYMEAFWDGGTYDELYDWWVNG